MEDWMIQKIRKEDKVILQVKLDTRMEVVVKWMKGFMHQKYFINIYKKGV